MHGSIGKQLGVLLADCEDRLYKGDLSVETMQKVALISEAYRNFTQSGVANFKADFDAGYSEMLNVLETELEELPSDRALLGDYFDSGPRYE